MGQIHSTSGTDVSAIHILNTSIKKATISDARGFFDIRASVGDTLIFSAIQFKRKEVVISEDMLESKMLLVPMEDALTELDEVVVTPYNLTGDMGRDANRLNITPVVTATSLGLPNAYVRVPTQAERMLFEATSGGGLLPLNPILNGISGR
ncbi:MAG: hypothetical protein AB3N16_10615, partial [Flavobacteriaceae bacterium]